MARLGLGLLAICLWASDGWSADPPATPPFTPAGHSTSILWSTWSPDGSQIATAAADRQILIWDVKTGQVVQRMTQEWQAFGKPVWSADGKRLMNSAQAGYLECVWDVATGSAIRKLADFQNLPGPGWLNADGSQAILPCRDGRLGVWDVNTGEVRLIGGFQRDTIYPMVADSTGTIGLGAGSNNLGQVIDLKSAKVLHTLVGHKQRINTVAITRDGVMGATCSNDNLVILWDLKTGQKKYEWKDHTTWVENVSFSDDGTRLASTDTYKTNIWDTKSGTKLKSLDIKESRRGAISGDGKLIATTEVPWVTIWDIDAGKATRELKPGVLPVRSLAMDSEGKFLFTGSDDGSVVVWDMGTGAPRKTWSAHGAEITRISCDSKGARIATGSKGRTAELWDAQTGEKLKSFELGVLGVKAMSLSPDGGRLLVNNDDQEAVAFDCSTGEKKPVGRGSFIQAVGWGPSGDICWIGSSHDHRALIVNANTGAPIRELRSPSSAVQTAAISPDGKSILTGHKNVYEGHSIVWSIETGKPTRTLVGHGKPVRAVCFSPDGTRAVTACGAGEGRIWSLSDGKELALLSGHRGEIVSVAWHPKDLWIATASLDGTTRLWSPKTGKELARLVSVDGGKGWIVATPDGRYHSSPDAISKANLHQAERFFQKPVPDLWTNLFSN